MSLRIAELSVMSIRKYAIKFSRDAEEEERFLKRLLTMGQRIAEIIAGNRHVGRQGETAYHSR